MPERTYEVTVSTPEDYEGPDPSDTDIADAVEAAAIEVTGLPGAAIDVTVSVL